jgi:hypothetical protein
VDGIRANAILYTGRDERGGRRHGGGFRRGSFEFQTKPRCFRTGLFQLVLLSRVLRGEVVEPLLIADVFGGQLFDALLLPHVFGAETVEPLLPLLRIGERFIELLPRANRLGYGVGQMFLLLRRLRGCVHAVGLDGSRELIAD